MELPQFLVSLLQVDFEQLLLAIAMMLSPLLDFFRLLDLDHQVLLQLLYLLVQELFFLVASPALSFLEPQQIISLLSEHFSLFSGSLQLSVALVDFLLLLLDHSILLLEHDFLVVLQLLERVLEFLPKVAVFAARLHLFQGHFQLLDLFFSAHYFPILLLVFQGGAIQLFF